MPTYNLQQLNGYLKAASDALAQGNTAANQATALGYIAQYYSAQTSFRGYAGDALQVVQNQGAYGITANQLVSDAMGASNFANNRASIALQLAQADFAIVTANPSAVPTESQIEAYHAAVFEANGIPITAWGGAAFAALGENWGSGLTPGRKGVRVHFAHRPGASRL
jgi:hypothetical protein